MDPLSVARKSTLLPSYFALIISLLAFADRAFPQTTHGHGGEHGTELAPDHGDPCGVHAQDDHGTPEEGADEGYDPGPMIMHHIKDANEWEITRGAVIPLPCIAWVPGEGLKTFMSSRFHHGEVAVDGFVLDHGRLLKVEGEFPSGEVHLDNHGHFGHEEVSWTENGTVKTKEKTTFCYEGGKYYASRHDLFVDGFAFAWLDLSITKNVATLFLVAIIMLWLFLGVAAAYRRRTGQPPRGVQNFMEPLIQFVQDDIIDPTLGPKGYKYMPYIMTAFFFIWIANMVGQLPFLANPNLTGNIAVTLALALITFILTTIGGNWDYWKHVFIVPGTPLAVKPILIPIEFIGIFTKPFALMIRLFANITAGHVILLSLTALIFVFGNLGQNMPGTVGGAAIAVLFGIFMGLIELLVAFLQAFIFAILSALFIGMAVEEHHGGEELI